MNSDYQDDRDECVYRVDGRGAICWVNDAWLKFAADNGWETSARDVVGSQLTDHISDAETRHIYALVEQRARIAPAPLRFDYRCDSPDLRRFMRMEVVYDPSAEQIEYRSRLLRKEPREAVALFDPALASRSSETVNVCSWCKTVEVGDGWLEVESAVAALGLLNEPSLPSISHGICPTCSARLTSQASAPARILVLDDNHLLATILSDHLRDPGFAVDAAFDVEQALRLCAQHHYDIVIADIVLPQSSGVEFVERLKQNKPACRALIITGLSLPDEDVAKLKALGVEAVIEKPFAFEEIARVVRRRQQ
jgi:CheY-like chemotaxis protein